MTCVSPYSKESIIFAGSEKKSQNSYLDLSQKNKEKVTKKVAAGQMKRFFPRTVFQAAKTC